MSITPAHAILASILGTRLAAETDSIIVDQLGPERLWAMCARSVMRLNRPLLKDRVKQINVLLTECQMAGTEAEDVPAQLMGIGWWDAFRKGAKN